MTTLKLQRAEYPAWHMGFCTIKLLLRAQLPGASIFDRCCEASMAARNLPVRHRLALALPASWMVNNPMPSPSLQGWLSDHHASMWHELIEIMDQTADDWSGIGQTQRDRAQALVDGLYAPGFGLTGITKVLAQLCPETVPLMDDAALWFALGSPAPPHNPQKPEAPARQFLPMVDWFTSHVVQYREILKALAEDHHANLIHEGHQTHSFPCPGLSAAQILDRLLWFESWGYHEFKAGTVWRWLTQGEREAIIPIQLEDQLPATLRQNPTARHEWPTEASPRWQTGSQELLDCVYEEVVPLP